MVGQAEAQVVVETPRVGTRRRPGQLEQRLDLGREGQPSVRHAVIQRLDPEEIAHQHQSALDHVEHREGEHAGQPQQRIAAPLVPRGQQHFGVPVRDEAMPRGFELLAQLAEVVDLAVEHQVMPPVRRAHRLPPGLAQIENRQAPVRKRHRRAGTDSRLTPRTWSGHPIPRQIPDVVGPPVAQARRRRIDPPDVHRDPRVGDDPGNAAHVTALLRSPDEPVPAAAAAPAPPRARARRCARCA